jgi:hypothetical protein
MPRSPPLPSRADRGEANNRAASGAYLGDDIGFQKTLDDEHEAD